MGSTSQLMVLGTQKSSVYSISYHSSSSQSEMEVDKENIAKRAPKRTRQAAGILSEMEVDGDNAEKAPKKTRRLASRKKKNKNKEVSSIDAQEIAEAQEQINVKSNTSLLKKIYPQHPQRLYAMICSNIDVEKVIFNMLLHTETNPEKLVVVLTQLFVDISCYQFVNLDTFLENFELKDLVPYLEGKENSILEKTGKYLLNMTTTPYMTKRKSLETFFETFILYCTKSQILYDVVTFRDIFLVLEAMGNSKRISIKHTGVFIALKISSGLVRVIAKYFKKLEQAVEALNNLESEEKKIQEENIQKYKIIHEKVNDMLNMLRNNVMLNNWNSSDPRLRYMRLDYINEIYYWMKILPSRYLRNNTLDFILSAVTDPHYTVRLRAIELLQHIVEQFYEMMLQERMAKVMSLLGLRMQDKNFQVAAAAVDALTTISYYKNIPHHIRKDICRYIYYPQFPFAQACGRHLVYKIKLQNPTDEAEDMIRSLIFFELSAIENGVRNLHAYLIEAIIDEFPYIQNIAAFMNLLDRPMSEKEKPVFLGILTESIRQTFTGKSSLPRARSRKGKIDRELNQKMSQDFITGLIKLSSIYKVEELTEVMVLVYEYRKSENNAAL